MDWSAIIGHDAIFNHQEANVFYKVMGLVSLSIIHLESPFSLNNIMILADTCKKFENPAPARFTVVELN